MRRGIRIQKIAIESAANNFPLMNDYSADWYFTGVERTPRCTKRFLHPEFVRLHGATIYCLGHGFGSRISHFRCSEFGCICGDDYNEERILNSDFRRARPCVSLAVGGIK